MMSCAGVHNETSSTNASPGALLVLSDICRSVGLRICLILLNISSRATAENDG